MSHRGTYPTNYLSVSLISLSKQRMRGSYIVAWAVSTVAHHNINIESVWSFFLMKEGMGEGSNWLYIQTWALHVSVVFLCILNDVAR